MTNIAVTRGANELWELCSEDSKLIVHQESDTSWRHGEYRTTVVKDPNGRFWMGTYCVSGDGETHEWRDGEASDFSEVEPYEVTTTAYRLKPTPDA